jgi:hypothetical protein
MTTFITICLVAAALFYAGWHGLKKLCKDINEPNTDYDYYD